MMQKNQQFIKAAVITVIIAGVLGALLALTADMAFSSAKLFAACFLLIIFGIPATISMVVTRKAEKQMMGNAGMVLSAAGFFISLIIIIGEVANESLLKFAVTLFIASIAMAHICLLHTFSLQNKYAYYARATATVAIAVFAFSLTIRVFDPLPGFYTVMYNQSSLKLNVAVLIIDLAATLLVPLCNRLAIPGPVDDLLPATNADGPDEPVQEDPAV